MYSQFTMVQFDMTEVYYTIYFIVGIAVSAPPSWYSASLWLLGLWLLGAGAAL